MCRFGGLWLTWTGYTGRCEGRFTIMGPFWATIRRRVRRPTRLSRLRAGPHPLLPHSFTPSTSPPHTRFCSTRSLTLCFPHSQPHLAPAPAASSSSAEVTHTWFKILLGRGQRSSALFFLLLCHYGSLGKTKTTNTKFRMATPPNTYYVTGSYASGDCK